MQSKCFLSTAANNLSSLNRKIKDMVTTGMFDQTLRFYREQLHAYGIRPDTSILPSLLKACSTSQSLHLGLLFHCMVLKIGHLSDVVTANSLLAMYAKCLRIETARQVFDEMPQRDTITWNSMVLGYIQNGLCVKAMEMFKKMYNSGFVPKPEVIASILSVCGRMRGLRLGREIHGRVICNGQLMLSVFLSTALLDMYSRCHDLPAALRVFDQTAEKNEVCWTAMIAGCTVCGTHNMSLQVFRAMQIEGMEPNRVTLITVLPAIAKRRVLKQGKEIHGYVIRHGLESESHIIGALIDMYCKCGGQASRLGWLVFERAERRDIVMWSSMIGSYSKSGDSVQAMKLFHQMQAEGIKPNSVTILAIIGTCIGLSSMNHGQGIHCCTVKSGLNLDIFVANSLIDMYGKCGFLGNSHQIFEEMVKRDTVSWSALISSYGLHGYGTEALQLLNEMQEMGFEPDEITFLATLSACNHAGLLEEGQQLFHRLIQDHNIAPIVEHYACYVDLLGRSGKIEDACEVIRLMPMKPSPSIWSSLVSACRVHGRFYVAEALAHKLIVSEPGNAANYKLLSMIFAETSNWVGVENIKRAMREEKSFRCSRLDVKTGIYSYPCLSY